jgi:glyoxylase-like metal-dependent hydrolase (beta-lactamase superfamily II)
MFKIRRFKDVTVYTELVSGNYNNVSVIDDFDGLILIDTFSKKKVMLEFLELIKQDFGKDVKIIILTHWHIDHSLGACLVNPTSLIASKECKIQLIDFIDNHQLRLRNKGLIETEMEIIIPNKIFEESLTILLSNSSIMLLESLPGHSYDSIIVKYDDIIFVGDNLVGEEVELFLPPLIPPDEAKSKPEHLLYAVRYLIQQKCKYIIPGHGSVIDGTSLLKSNLKKIKEQMIINNIPICP